MKSVKTTGQVSRISTKHSKNGYDSSYLRKIIFKCEFVSGHFLLHEGVK